MRGPRYRIRASESLGLLPLVTVDACLAQDSGEQVPADIGLMRIRTAEGDRAPDHELVPPSGERPVEAQRPQSANQLGAADRPEGGHELCDGPDRQLVTVDDWE